MWLVFLLFSSKVRFFQIHVCTKLYSFSLSFCLVHFNIWMIIFCTFIWMIICRLIFRVVLSFLRGKITAFVKFNILRLVFTWISTASNGDAKLKANSSTFFVNPWFLYCLEEPWAFWKFKELLEVLQCLNNW